MMKRGRLTTLCLCAGLVLLAACGRKSNLDTPYQAAIDARNEAKQNDEPLPPEPAKPVKDRPFILDPLI